MRRARVSEDDRAAWHDYARTVQRLPGRAATVTPFAPSAPVPAPVPLSLPAAGPGRPPPPPLAIGAAAPGLDRASWERLRTGRLPVARRIDLHGMTVQAAHDALVGFLRRGHAEGARCVEVVTGRGSSLGTGVIRRELPHWLNLPSIRPLLLAAAHPARNVGVTLILLRRERGQGDRGQGEGRVPKSAVPTRTSVAP